MACHGNVGGASKESQMVEDGNLWMLEDTIAKKCECITTHLIKSCGGPLVPSGFQAPEACVNASLQSSRGADDKVPDTVAAMQMGDDAAWSSCARMKESRAQRGGGTGRQ